MQHFFRNRVVNLEPGNRTIGREYSCINCHNKVILWSMQLAASIKSFASGSDVVSLWWFSSEVPSTRWTITAC
ncbi:hypothetical protein HOLleu_20903 [Holothuria leucospilota]|uniref:Uncharacterized protein n=1 Tax=Holothuria leucospilota TaxID=206669 RepID=A0A9Q1BWT1_HOLLE|nr:hypothetical protein HOLleu_20903 [Holothuria leucospilota]